MWSKINDSKAIFCKYNRFEYKFANSKLIKCNGDYTNFVILKIVKSV